MSDQIAVLAEGRVEQVGPPQEIYSAPGHHVRRRIPRRGQHLRRRRARVRRRLGGVLGARHQARRRGRRRAASPGPAAIVIRPERITLQAPTSRSPPGTTSLRGTRARQVVYLGRGHPGARRRRRAHRADRRGGQPRGPGVGGLRARRDGAAACAPHDAVRVLPRSSAAASPIRRSRLDAARLSATRRPAACRYRRASRAAGRVRVRRSASRCRRPRSESTSGSSSATWIDKPVEQRGELQREHPRVDRADLAGVGRLRRVDDHLAPARVELDPAGLDLVVPKRLRPQVEPQSPGAGDLVVAPRHARPPDQQRQPLAQRGRPRPASSRPRRRTILLRVAQRVDEQPVAGAEVVDDEGRADPARLATSAMRVSPKPRSQISSAAARSICDAPGFVVLGVAGSPCPPSSPPVRALV